MKAFRLFALLANSVLLGIIVYAGIAFQLSEEYLRPTHVAVFRPNPIPWPPDPPRPLSEYIEATLSDPPPPPPPPKPETLDIEVRAVVFNSNNPAKSGAHVVIARRNITRPRYFEIGDYEKTDKGRLYYLKDVKEVGSWGANGERNVADRSELGRVYGDKFAFENCFTIFAP